MTRLAAALLGLMMTLALVSPLAASPAAAASFDCAKARTKVEKLICADPQLSRQDSELAAAYGEAQKAWDGKIAAYVKMTQRGWVGSRTLLPPGQDMGGVYCNDDDSRLSCLRDIHAERIAVLKSPGFRLSGIYVRGQDFLAVKIASAGLRFGYYLTGVNAIDGGTDEAKPVRVAPGQTAVTFPLVGTGPDACRVDAAFTADAVVLTQKGPCSRAKLNGRWARDQARDPEGELF
jgi:uncharacterized protein YecT (DUF1311 family)